MIFRFFSRDNSRATAEKLYGAILEQSRRPQFFADLEFADTVTGRFDMLALHMMLFSRRLSSEADAAAMQLSQAVFDEFTNDVDDALRALGIGDTSVPKRKQALIRGFYAQVEEFVPLLDKDLHQEMVEKLARRFSLSSTNASKLAGYAKAAALSLAALEFDVILQGNIDWPDPASFTASEK